MTTSSSPTMQTHTLAVPGAALVYDVRPGDGSSTAPPLVLIGSPMDASGFVTLASHFTDRTVVTYDPRGVSRSVRTDGASRSTPEEHADDVRRVIEAAVGDGPVDLFASSGGAVNALALVAAHPSLLRTAVAHEPPTVQVLPEREDALAAVHGIAATYTREGQGPAMAQFIALTMHKGPVPAGFADDVRPDPAAFGLPAEDDGSRDDVLLGQNLVTCCTYEPDFAALGAATTRLVVAVGEESEGEVACRGGLGVAERLGVEPVVFPSNHAGFLGGEFGMTGQPEAFAAKLRDVLD